MLYGRGHPPRSNVLLLFFLSPRWYKSLKQPWCADGLLQVQAVGTLGCWLVQRMCAQTAGANRDSGRLRPSGFPGWPRVPHPAAAGAEPFKLLCRPELLKLREQLRLTPISGLLVVTRPFESLNDLKPEDLRALRSWD